MRLRIGIGAGDCHLFLILLHLKTELASLQRLLVDDLRLERIDFILTLIVIFDFNLVRGIQIGSKEVLQQIRRIFDANDLQSEDLVFDVVQVVEAEG
jgi:hypothetical protein